MLKTREPTLYARLIKLISRVRRDPGSVAAVRWLFATKSTRGHGVNAFLDFDRPVHVLAHLLIGSDGTLGFVGSAVCETIPVVSNAATGLPIFSDPASVTAAVPALIAAGFVMIDQHAALLIEMQSATEEALLDEVETSCLLLRGLPLNSTQASFAFKASDAPTTYTRL